MAIHQQIESQQSKFILFDLRISKSGGRLPNSQFLYMKDFDESICTQMVNDLMEYRGTYTFCFMVTEEIQKILIKKKKKRKRGKSRDKKSKSKSKNPKNEIQNLKPENPKSETRHPKSEIQNLKPDIRNPKSKIRHPQSTI